MKRIKVTIQSVKGECSAGCKVGDVFYYEDGSITLEDLSTKLCAYGISAIVPYMSGFCRASDSEDWMAGYEEADFQCPDPINAVMYHLEKID